MNIFSVNQVNQVYVAEGENAEVVTLSSSANVDKAKTGSIGVGTTPDGKSVYFVHVGKGGITRTDLIDKDKIEYIKLTKAAKMARELKTIKVTLNDGVLDNSNVVAGKDFVLRVKIAQVLCPNPNDAYWKFGSVHSTSGMTASTFWKKMAISLVRSMGQEAISYIKVFLGSTEVTPTTKESDLTGSYDSLLLKEVEGDWILGLKQQKPLNFTVEPSTVNIEGEEVVWADTIDSKGNKVTGGVDPVSSIDTTNKPASAGTVGNGKLMADLEYFCMGERADMYRMKGYPNYVPTEYMVNPANTYDTIGIHYSYVGSNHAVQKSEKDITLIVNPDLTEDLQSAIGAATGTTVKVVGN